MRRCCIKSTVYALLYQSGRLAAPAKNYIVLSVESDSANFFENFKDTLYLIIFFTICIASDIIASKILNT